MGRHKKIERVKEIERRRRRRKKVLKLRKKEAIFNAAKNKEQ